jgi:hypothetical protein
MANQLYTKAKEDLLRGNLNLQSNTITIILVDTGVYSFNAAHEDRADIPNTAVVSSNNLISKTTTGGVLRVLPVLTVKH